MVVQGIPIYEEGRSFRIVTIHRSLDQSKENDSSEVNSPHSSSSTKRGRTNRQCDVLEYENPDRLVKAFRKIAIGT